jgi:hypothetical protein
MQPLESSIAEVERSINALLDTPMDLTAYTQYEWKTYPAGTPVYECTLPLTERSVSRGQQVSVHITVVEAILKGYKCRRRG